MHLIPRMIARYEILWQLQYWKSAGLSVDNLHQVSLKLGQLDTTKDTVKIEIHAEY